MDDYERKKISLHACPKKRCLSSLDTEYRVLFLKKTDLKSKKTDLKSKSRAKIRKYKEKFL